LIPDHSQALIPEMNILSSARDTARIRFRQCSRGRERLCLLLSSCLKIQVPSFKSRIQSHLVLGRRLFVDRLNFSKSFWSRGRETVPMFSFPSLLLSLLGPFLRLSFPFFRAQRCHAPLSSRCDPMMPRDPFSDRHENILGSPLPSFSLLSHPPNPRPFLPCTAAKSRSTADLSWPVFDLVRSARRRKHTKGFLATQPSNFPPVPLPSVNLRLFLHYSVLFADRETSNAQSLVREEAKTALLSPRFP